MDPIIRYFLRVFDVSGNPHILMLIFVVFCGDGFNWLGRPIYPAVHYGQHWVWHCFVPFARQMFDHLQKLSLAFYDRNEVGRIMSRILNDVGSLGKSLE